MIAGQILTRTQEHGHPDKPGTVLVAIIGIIEVPKGHVLDSEGQQFVVTGVANDGVSQLEIHHRMVEDHTEVMKGVGFGQALTMPIWRKVR